MCSVIPAQEFYFQQEFGDFSTASSFCYNPSGYFYISDALRNEIFKLDTLGNQVKYIGGYGWATESFDNPVDIFCTALKVYVSDRNNNRIQLFDADLNYISMINGSNDNNNEQSSFGYPLSCAVSPIGDMYILDSENKRIVKFDISGNFVLQFGGYDSGVYYLSDPKKLAIIPGNKIVVIDKTDLVIFDQFGNGMGRINFNEPISNVHLSENILIVNSDNQIFGADLSEFNVEFEEIKLDKSPVKIIEVIWLNDALYILTEENIEVFRKKG